jgi:hypothetical protein
MKKIELLKYPEGTEPARDGLHLPATAGQGSETLCGVFADGPESPEYVEGPRPECANCIKMAAELFGRYSKKQVAGWDR